MALREEIQFWVAIIQSAVTVGAIILGGWWFIVRGETETRANVSHTVTHVGISDQWTWVLVITKVENVGKTNLNLDSGIIRIQKILPLDEKVKEKINAKITPVDQKEKIVLWPTIGDAYNLSRLGIKIAPGEEETLEHEFIIPHYIQTVKIYSYLGEEGRPIGWHRSTIYSTNR
jgi:hypothetical protein